MKGFILFILLAYSPVLFAQKFSSNLFSWELIDGYIVVNKSQNINSGKYEVLAKRENFIYDKTNGNTLKTPQTIYRLMYGKKYMYITYSSNKNDTTSDIYYPDPDFMDNPALDNYFGGIYMSKGGEGEAQWSVTQKIVDSFKKSADWKKL